MVVPDYSRKAYDILVYGASGYTGRYVAKYIHSLGLGLKWAIGGRSQSKLASLMAELRGACEMGLPGIHSFFNFYLMYNPTNSHKIRYAYCKC